MGLVKWTELAKSKTDLGNKINLMHDTILHDLGQKGGGGVWSYTDFDQYIKTNTNQGDKYSVSLEFDTTTVRVTITLDPNYQIDLTKSNFNDLIGFDHDPESFDIWQWLREKTLRKKKNYTL